MFYGFRRVLISLFTITVLITSAATMLHNNRVYVHKEFSHALFLNVRIPYNKPTKL